MAHFRRTSTITRDLLLSRRCRANRPTNSTPATNPPMSAYKAIPAPDRPGELAPHRSCKTNQVMINRLAGRSSPPL